MSFKFLVKTFIFASILGAGISACSRDGTFVGGYHRYGHYDDVYYTNGYYGIGEGLNYHRMRSRYYNGCGPYDCDYNYHRYKKGCYASGYANRYSYSNSCYSNKGCCR